MFVEPGAFQRGLRRRRVKYVSSSAVRFAERGRFLNDDSAAPRGRKRTRPSGRLSCMRGRVIVQRTSLGAARGSLRIRSDTARATTKRATAPPRGLANATHASSGRWSTRNTLPVERSAWSAAHWVRDVNDRLISEAGQSRRAPEEKLVSLRQAHAMDRLALALLAPIRDAAGPRCSLVAEPRGARCARFPS